MNDAQDNAQGAEKTRYEEFTVAGGDLLSRVKELVHEGNVRRVFIKNSEGRTLLEIPLTAGVGVAALAALIAPVLVAVGAIAAMLTNVTVGVERVVEDEAPGAAKGGEIPPAE
jgi:Domain of unknown function (DUF4342)